MEGGGVQWGGLNEDAADYPIRKFSLHFDRARRAASNKNYSMLRANRFPPTTFHQFFVISTCLVYLHLLDCFFKKSRLKLQLPRTWMNMTELNLVLSVFDLKLFKNNIFIRTIYIFAIMK